MDPGYTEPCIAEGCGVVGSCSARLQQVRDSNHGGGGSRFGWILAAGKKNLRNSVSGVRVNVYLSGEYYTMDRASNVVNPEYRVSASFL